MSHEIFTAISNLRMVLDTETDYNSPINETTFAAILWAINRMQFLVDGLDYAEEKTEGLWCDVAKFVLKGGIKDLQGAADSLKKRFQPECY